MAIVANADDIAALTEATIISGSVITMAGNSVPSGYLECNGSAISRATYAALFSVISTLYGVGDGSTTFNIPDLRGQFVRGWDNGAGVDAGRSIGTNQTDELRSHRHSALGQAGPYNGQPAGGSPITAGNTGYFGGDETRPINVAMMYCIKT